MSKYKNSKHLSLAGVGPAYVICITIITLIFIFIGLRISERISLPDYISRLLGALFIIIGIFVWYKGALKSNLHKKIKENQLITDGIYAYVRNPIYFAFMILEWGILLLLLNPLIGLAIPLYWLILTIMIKNTEEKWLLELYGQEYVNYCKKVNRCIPWFRN